MGVGGMKYRAYSQTNGLLFFAPDALRFMPYDKEFELYSMVYRSSSETVLKRSAPQA